MTWFRRFHAHGVFWRQGLRWGVLNMPLWYEPAVLAFWSMFFLFWGPARRGVMKNLAAVLPGSSPVANFFRTYRVFWNYAWTIADNVRFKEMRVSPDWEFTGMEHFEQLQSGGTGAIILTAHMGSYDLGAHLFAESGARRIVMVRAPEIDPQTQAFEQEQQARWDQLKIGFSSRAGELALDLLEALQRGEIIAIQGDRVTGGISTVKATLFGKETQIPAGPFALAMAARVPIYPLFIFRLGRRRYRLETGKPFDVVRTRDRNEAIDRAVALWAAELERVIGAAWFQWFMFEPYYEDSAA